MLLSLSLVATSQEETNVAPIIESDRQNPTEVQQINPSVAGILGSFVNSALSGLRPASNNGGFYQAGLHPTTFNGFYPATGNSFYPGNNQGYYPAAGGFYPGSGGFYPGSIGFYPGTGGYFPGSGGFYPVGGGFYPGFYPSVGGQGEGYYPDNAVKGHGYYPGGGSLGGGYQPSGIQVSAITSQMGSDGGFLGSFKRPSGNRRPFGGTVPIHPSSVIQISSSAVDGGDQETSSQSSGTAVSALSRRPDAHQLPSVYSSIKGLPHRILFVHRDKNPLP